ncbi:pollen receptor-like kinase 3 [Aristolochia californica]|uniref:pollen receptor-like kinase 3 n=1 Tax=Aristolochia californica TaxID=171875 RepID=UPI0035DBD98F
MAVVFHHQPFSLSFPCLPFVLFVSLLVSPLSSALTEAEALLNLKNKFTNTGALDSWDSKSVPCDAKKNNWAGVVCNYGVVTALHLGHMSLSGEVDIDALLQLPGLRSVSLVNNSFDGTMPEFNHLGALKSLFLTANHFTGDIPDDFFTKMESLKKVWLNQNAFTGAIPNSLSKLIHLIELRLEHNQFSGALPEFTQSTLKSFNVSDNPKLEGVIPQSLEGFDKSSFSANPGLCGQKADKICDASDTEGGKGSDKSKLIGMSLVLILCLVSVVVLATKKRRNQDFDTLGGDHGEDVVEVCVSSHNPRKSSTHSTRRAVEQSGHHRKDSHAGSKKPTGSDIIMVNDEKGVFGLQDLLKAAAELIGTKESKRHSAYKAVMANGIAVVVKRMTEMNRVGEDGFGAEMRRLGKLRHPNLLTPLAFCNKKEVKLLVYEHVPGGNLDFLLHGNRSVELNWQTRLKIVQGIIQGLGYLHSELPNSDIPHGNLKSSNVLLGPDLVPLLTDFGFSPLVIPTHASYSMFAYKSPESLQYRHVSPKSDVYCLGILILEILTGKYPSQYDNGAKGGTDLVEWVSSAMKDKQETEVLDPEIAPKNEPARTCMERLLHLGAECAEPNPERRPDIKEVLRRMEEIVTMAAAQGGQDDGSGRRSHAENVRALSTKRRDSLNDRGGSSSWSDIDSSGFDIS